METDQDIQLAEDVMGYFRKSHNKIHVVKKLLMVDQISSLFSDYRRASFLYQQFAQVLRKDACDLILMTDFVQRCGQHFADWVILQGSLDTLEIFLDFSNRMKYTYRKGVSPRYKPDYHPVNRSIYCGRSENIPLMLRYGLGLEFSESFYERLQLSVIRNMVISAQRSECKKRIKHLPNRRRVFLILLVIRTYNYSEKFPRFYKGADKALQMIFRSLPDSPLCRNEILEIFAGLDANFNKLEKIFEHYRNLIWEDDFTDLGQPRSLVHLSRCKIRQVLSFNRELPTGVDNLPIPMKLKSYLLLEE